MFQPEMIMDSEPEPAAIAPIEAPPPPPPAPRPKPVQPVSALVEDLRDAGQDHEFYPTTDAIIRSLITSLRAGYETSRYTSVLDIGAGNGKVLLALRAASNRKNGTSHEESLHIQDLHAIEKSSILCAQLDPDILVIGTDFHEQSLLSKQVDVIFCNPPYSQFELWAEKIIRESAAKVVYLVLPQRWEQSVRIKDALRFRDVKPHRVGDFDFEDAEDRKARAKVQLLRIDYGRGREDAFERFFSEQFADLIGKFDPKERDADADETDYDKRQRQKESGPPEYKQLVPGPNYPDAMVNLYRADVDKVQRNYQLVSQLDVDLLREFEIFPAKIMDLLKTKLTGLRDDYWNELFSRLNTVTDRLTAGSRKKLLEVLHKHVQVDFTVPNIYEIIVWVIKNANRYLDSQIIETYALMVDKCNVHLYKSNKRVWVDEGWRYNGDPEKNSHYALDYRIVTHRVGGVSNHYGTQELDESAADFLGDLLTIARNLGFESDKNFRFHMFDYRGRRDWSPGEKYEFYTLDGDILYDVKAFKNRNLHLRFNQKFIMALNVEHGRLRGWLRTPEQAAEELQDEAAAGYFRSNLQLGIGDPGPMLCERNAA